jgi:hypothetical protein
MPVMPGLVPAIHVFVQEGKALWPGHDELN